MASTDRRARCRTPGTAGAAPGCGPGRRSPPGARPPRRCRPARGRTPSRSRRPWSRVRSGTSWVELLGARRPGRSGVELLEIHLVDLRLDPERAVIVDVGELADQLLGRLVPGLDRERVGAGQRRGRARLVAALQRPDALLDLRGELG